jgi:RecB family exonuclease
MIERFASYVQEAATAGRRLVGTELDLRVEMPSTRQGDPAVLLTGQVDRLEQDTEGRLVVLDLKTSGSKPSRDEIITHAQLGAYQVAIEEGAFRPTVAGRSGGAQLVNLGTGEKQVTQAQPPVAESDDPGWAHAMVRTAARGMAGSTFPAHDLGQRCRRCPARFCCPLQPEGRQR